MYFDTWIVCFSGDFFYGLYHGKAPFFHHHLGKYVFFYLFQASNKQIQGYEDNFGCEIFVFLQDHGDEIPDSPLGIGIWPVPL